MIANVVRDLALDSFNWPGGAAFAAVALVVTLGLLAAAGRLTAAAERSPS
jgi:ABC-type spermidine/putrescine transport system permease subunit I